MSLKMLKYFVFDRERYKLLKELKADKYKDPTLDVGVYAIDKGLATEEAQILEIIRKTETKTFVTKKRAGRIIFLSKIGKQSLEKAMETQLALEDILPEVYKTKSALSLCDKNYDLLLAPEVDVEPIKTKARVKA